MIKPYCDWCGTELEEPGGLVFSPPLDRACRKYHICQSCFWDKLWPLTIQGQNKAFEEARERNLHEAT